MSFHESTLLNNRRLPSKPFLCHCCLMDIFQLFLLLPPVTRRPPHPETQREIQRTCTVEQLSSVLPPEQPPSASFPPPHSHGLGSSQWHLGIESPRSKKVFTFSSNEKYYMRKLAPTLYYYGGFLLDKKGCFLQILCHLTVLANITVMF